MYMCATHWTVNRLPLLTQSLAKSHCGVVAWTDLPVKMDEVVIVGFMSGPMYCHLVTD